MHTVRSSVDQLLRNHPPLASTQPELLLRVYDLFSVEAGSLDEYKAFDAEHMWCAFAMWMSACENVQAGRQSAQPQAC